MSMTRALASGFVLGTLAASEPQARRNLALTLSFAIEYKDQSGDYWIINGVKDYVPLCGVADMYLVVARTSPNPHGGLTFFMLPKYYPGMFWVGPTADSVGCRSLTHRTLVLACCIVRAEMRVAPEQALKVMRQAVDPFQLFLASAAVGAASTALAMAHEWLLAPSHRHFGHELIGYQALEHRVVRLTARVEAARLVAQGAAAAMDARDKAAPGHAAMAKRYCVAAALEVLEGVRALFGAASVASDFPLARLRRNLLAYQLLGGDGEACVDTAWVGLVSKRKAKVKGAVKKKKKDKDKAAAAGARGGKSESSEEDEDDEDAGDDGGTEEGNEAEEGEGKSD